MNFINNLSKFSGFQVRRWYSDQNKPNVPKTAEPPSAQNVNEQFIGGRIGNLVAPNSWERKFIVWMGKYKTVEDVPRTVPFELVEKARSKARIRIANVMMAVTALACIGYVISGKRAAERGESVHQMNVDWHKEVAKADNAKN